MKRSTLLSVMIIGAVVSLVVGAGTFAAFSASDSEGGGVSAGTLTIDVKGPPDAVMLLFGPGDTSCPDEMAPGDDCLAVVYVENTGTVYGQIDSVDVTGASDPAGDCEDTYWTGSSDAVAGTVIAPGDTINFNAFAHLDETADDDCQDVDAIITVEVFVSSIPTPP